MEAAGDDVVVVVAVRHPVVVEKARHWVEARLAVVVASWQLEEEVELLHRLPAWVAATRPDAWVIRVVPSVQARAAVPVVGPIAVAAAVVVLVLA